MAWQSNIIGHNAQKKYLQKQIESGKISHAYLFVGIANLGKLELAKFFASSIICSFQDKALKPCKKCDNCKQMKKGIYPDFHYFEPLQKNKSESINISQIRELINKFSKKNFSNGFKVALINKVDYINSSAANALLKTLEEPAENQVIILITENIEKLPATIVSRCQVLNFLPVSKIEIENSLKKSGAKEEEKNILSSLAGGCPMIAVNYLRKPKKLEKYKEEVNWCLDFFKNNKKNLKISLLDKKIKSIKPKKIKKLITLWLIVFRDLLLVKNNLNHLVLNNFSINKLEELNKTTTLKQIKKNIKELENIKEASINSNLKLSLESFIINN